MTCVHEEEWPAGAAAFERVTVRHEPTIFRGCARGWLPAEAGEELDVLDWLGATVGHRLVPVNIGLPGDDGFIGNAAFSGGAPIATTLTGRRAFGDIAREMKREILSPSGHLLYVQSLPIDTFAPELRGCLQLPGQLPAGGHWRAWIGTGCHRGYLHIDGTENAYGVLAGEKHFMLMPFDVLPDIYVGPLEGGAYQSPASVVDPLQPDLVKYPRFARALERAIHVVLKAGDVLYLPCGWWHAVDSRGFNMSINYWWYDLDNQTRTDAEATFMRALVSLRTLPRHWREFWNVMFHSFVFRAEGDPLAHIDRDEQGFAGEPTPARLLFIKSQLAEREASAKEASVKEASAKAPVMAAAR